MIQHTIQFVPDFSETEEKVTKTLWFNLRLSALQNMINLEGWDQKIKWMADEFDINDLDHRRRIQEFWNVIIERSYGVRDGDRFIQTPELAREFMGSAEYDALITDILYTADSKVASKFITGLFPRKLVDEIVQRSGNTSEVSELDRRAEGS